jgi:hypothetical protein
VEEGVSKQPGPPGSEVRESWARIRTGARVAVEQGAKAIRLLVAPSLRTPSPPPPPPSQTALGPGPGDAGAPRSERTPGSDAPPASSRGVASPAERAQYRRIQTPAFFRAAGLRPFLHLTTGEGREARLRMYSDERHVCGEHLKLDVVFPTGEDRTFTAEVAWLDELPQGSPARYDVGLRVLDIDLPTRQLIASCLASQEG